MTRLTIPPRRVYRTFMDFPFVPDLEQLDAHFAIIGMPYGDPYSIDELVNDQTNAPTAIRRASERMSLGLDRWDFDIGGTLFDGKDIKVVDVGDVPGDARNVQLHYQLAEQAIRRILAAGASRSRSVGITACPFPYSAPTTITDRSRSSTSMRTSTGATKSRVRARDIRARFAAPRR